jgi:hypothetical protein
MRTEGGESAGYSGGIWRDEEWSTISADHYYSHPYLHLHNTLRAAAQAYGWRFWNIRRVKEREVQGRKASVFRLSLERFE